MLDCLIHVSSEDFWSGRWMRATNSTVEISSWYKYTVMHTLPHPARRRPFLEPFPIMSIHFFLPDSAITFFNRAAIFEVDACDLVTLLFDSRVRAVVNLLSATIAAL